MLSRFVFGLIVICLLSVPCVNAQNLLDSPMYVTFDTLFNRYMVACYQNNAIVAIDAAGHQTLFHSGLYHATGILVDGPNIYVNGGPGNNTLLVLDLASGAVISQVYLTGCTYAVGMVSDTSGYLYVVDQSDAVFRVRKSDLSYTLFARTTGGVGPQDVTFDAAHNRLLVCCYVPNAPIFAISLPDGVVTDWIPRAPGYHDGITIDAYGTVYASNFWENRIYAWDNNGSNMRILPGVYGSGPKGLDYNIKDRVLAIPILFDNRVDFIPLDADGDGILMLQDNCLETYNPDQADADWDVIGDACDACTDLDYDGYANPGYPASTCPIDNCPDFSNPNQSDQDDDGVGDVCDNCRFVNNADQLDGNGDCPALPYGLDPKCGDACLGCCLGRVGDANGSNEPTDEVTLGDIMLMVDVKFISGDCTKLLCLAEADVNQDGGTNPTCDDHVTLGDIMTLVDFLFITGPETAILPDCL